MLLIWLASSRSEVASTGFLGEDKIVHFFVFGLLATLLARTDWTARRPWLAVLLASLYGLLDEAHQSFTPGRMVDVADWVADTLGACVAVWVYVKWTAYRHWLETPLGSSRDRKSRIENRERIPPNRDVA